MLYWPLVVTCIFNYTFTSVSLALSVRAANKRQELAYGGDATAAKRIILPCYKPLFIGLIVFYALLAVILCLTFSDTTIEKQYFHVLQYFNFCSIGTYLITPVLLVQSSVSITGFWNTFYTIMPWWVVCSTLWGLSFLKGPSAYILTICFLLCASVPPICLSVLMLTKLIKSRVQLGSFSNRNSIEFLLLYSGAFGVLYCVAVIGVSSNDTKFYITAVITAISFVCNQIFPFALYRTLLADTKFWRGLGRHNKMGINVHDDLRESGVNVFRPTMDLSVISSTFQDMMSNIGDISVDFAYLQLEKIIGHGATSEVYCGRYKSKIVAIKVSNPPEVTEEAIDVFVAEAKIASSLDHPNIVKFIGICVRPPQIAMVFEFCEGGNLKSNLQKNKDKWTPVKRISACLDACRAIESFHERKLIHRDLKADNFFVGRKQVVKLGDFGESTHVRTKESTKAKRMTILGTVAFMAPELIAAERYYNESIDIYALAVTMWEIWTGKDPYEEFTQFDIYAKVAAGCRPTLPTDSPPGFTDVLEEAWQVDPARRPSGTEMVAKVERILHVMLHGGEDGGEDGEEGEEEDEATKGPRINASSDAASVTQVNPILRSASSARPPSSGAATAVSEMGRSRPNSNGSDAIKEKQSDIELPTRSTSAASVSTVSS